MIRIILERVYRTSGNCPISEKRTIQPKTSEITGGKLNGTQISGRTFPKIPVYLARLSSLPEISENLVPFVTGNFENSTGDFLSD